MQVKRLYDDGLVDDIKKARTDTMEIIYQVKKEEAYAYRDQINELQNQIRLMQQGMTLGDIAQKEAVWYGWTLQNQLFHKEI